MPSVTTNAQSAPGDVRFSAALLIATVLKAMAVLSFVGGIFATGAAAAAAKDAFDRSESIITIVATGIAGTLVTSALFGFGAYTLEILVGVFDEILELRLSLVDDDDESGTNDDDKWSQLPRT